jgi:hypothetical protein
MKKQSGRIFRGPAAREKPGFPLQVLGSAHALPAGFPLQSPCAEETCLSPFLNRNIYEDEPKR